MIEKMQHSTINSQNDTAITKVGVVSSIQASVLEGSSMKATKVSPNDKSKLSKKTPMKKQMNLDISIINKQ